MRTTTRKRLALGAAAITLAGAGFVGAIGSGPAKADPPEPLGLAFAGVGSDTTQAVMDAFSGMSNGKSYARAISQGGVIDSYDATVQIAGSVDPCIATTYNGLFYTRPNGSGAGVKALSAPLAAGNATAPTTWLGDNAALGHEICGYSPFAAPNSTTVATATAEAKNIGGQVDFARSSSGPSGGTTELTWVPFAKDAVSLGYVYKGAGTAVTNFTRQNLVDLYNTGPQVIGGTLVLPCDLNVLSGTRKFFGTVSAQTTNLNNSNPSLLPNTIAGLCSNNGATIFEENNLAPVATRINAMGTVSFGGNTYTDYQLVVPHSAAAFIAQSNLVAPNSLPTSGTFGIAAIRDNTLTTTCAVAVPTDLSCNIGSPYTGSGTNLVPSTIFYDDAVFSRKVYNVLPTGVMTATAGASLNPVLRSLFYGPTSPICLGTSIITAFGFQNLPVGNGTGTSTCGSTGGQGSYSPPNSTFS